MIILGVHFSHSVVELLATLWRYGVQVGRERGREEGKEGGREGGREGEEGVERRREKETGKRRE
jgi:hypothetical protein